MSFSFLSAPVASASTDNQDTINSNNNNDSSSFLNLMRSPSPSNELPSAPSSSASSGFSFMSPSLSSPAISTDLLGSVIATPDTEIKLAKVAAVKIVKKKKRSSNIGAGRQDDDDNDNDIQSPVPPPVPSTIHEPIQIKSNMYEETTRDSLNEMPPPPPLPPVMASLPQVHAVLPTADVKSTSTANANVSVEVKSIQSNDINNLALGVPLENELDAIPLLRRSYSGLHDNTPRELPLSDTNMGPPQVKPVNNSSPKKETSKVSSSWDNALKIAEDDYATFDATVRNLCQVKDNSLKELRDVRCEIDKEEQLLRNLQLKLADQEKEQQQLAEQEEFEKADLLSSAIDKLRGDIEMHLKNVEKLNAAVLNAEKRAEQATSAHSSAVIKVVNSLEDFSKKILLEKNRIHDDSKERHEREDSRLRSEEERISLEQKHVEKAEEVLEEELRTTEDAIQAQSGDAVAQEAEMADKLTIVAMEIDALEAQLAVKREEEKKLKVEMTAIQNKVFEVRKKYDRQLKNIKERKEVIEINKYECQKEKSLLDNERAILDKDIEQFSSLIEGMDKQKESVALDIQLIEILQKSQNSNVMLVSSEKSPGGYEEFKRALTEASMAISDAINKQAALTKRVELLGFENRAIDEKIPTLETEKKAHAAAKRFKEAAAVAKDIQALKSKQDDNTKEIDEITAEIPQHADIIFTLRQKEVEAKSNLLAAQKDEDIIRFTVLRKRLKELQSAKRKIVGFAESAKLKECCLFSIDTELNGVLAEANIIKEEHSLDDSLDDDDIEDEVIVNTTTSVEISSKDNEDNIITEDTTAIINETDECIPAAIETINEKATEVTAASNEVDDTVEAVVESAEAVEPAEPAENNQSLEQAKYLLQVIAETEKLLTEASDAENYEDAAVYQEKLEEITQLLQTQLIDLKLTEDEVRKML